MYAAVCKNNFESLYCIGQRRGAPLLVRYDLHTLSFYFMVIVSLLIIKSKNEIHYRVNKEFNKLHYRVKNWILHNMY